MTTDADWREPGSTPLSDADWALIERHAVGPRDSYARRAPERWTFEVCDDGEVIVGAYYRNRMGEFFKVSPAELPDDLAARYNLEGAVA